MELAQKMFLLAAEELNFTKAAKRAFVTQQCLSEHIQKLEKQMGTKLFLRSPICSLPRPERPWRAPCSRSGTWRKTCSTGYPKSRQGKSERSVWESVPPGPGS